MIEWGAPGWLYALLSVPTLAALYVAFFLRKRRASRRIADPGLWPRLIETRSGRLQGIRAVLTTLSIVFLVLAAARPRWGEKLQIYTGRAIDIVLALDASKSMRAEDIKPDRLTRAKAELSALVDELRSDRVGVTAFAGDCFVMCPLTADLDAAKDFLDIVSEDVVPVPGTNLKRAVEVSIGLFDPKERAHKALVLVTDGDDLGPSPLETAERARAEGVKIFTVAVGTPEGAPIPEKDEQGNLVQYKKDEGDQIVMSRTNEQLLITISRATGGRYYRAQGLDLAALTAELGRIKKRETGSSEVVARVERYPYPLTLAILFLVLALALSDRKGAWLRKPLFGLLLLAGASSLGADVGSSMREGNRLYSEGKFEEALKSYEAAEMFEPDDPRIHFNKGDAFYGLENYEEALREYQMALLTEDGSIRARALYNVGNVMMRTGKLDEAIGSYAASLLLNPDDMEAKQNLEFALKMREQQQGQESQDPQDQQQEKEEKKEQEQPQQEQQEQEPEEERIDREQAERILESLKDEEKEAMKKSRAREEQRGLGGKDW
jgi:Ca-activated chloride channel family protein